MARFLIVLGLAILVVGLLWHYLGTLGLGRLPGDIVIERENGTVYVPRPTVLVLRLQASSSERSLPRTAATTSALRRMTQRLVPGAGKSAMVSGLPSGPMTYLARGRRGSVINDLTHPTAKSRGR